jgi:hypothetical protein
MTRSDKMIYASASLYCRNPFPAKGSCSRSPVACRAVSRETCPRTASQAYSAVGLNFTTAGNVSRFPARPYSLRDPASLYGEIPRRIGLG